MRLAGAAWLLALVASAGGTGDAIGDAAQGGAPAPAAPPPALTSLWRDTPADTSRVRIDAIPEIIEPSDLLLRGGSLYTVSDSVNKVYRLVLDGSRGRILKVESWKPVGLPSVTDLEAMTSLPGGEVLLANETTGSLFVLKPFPDHACAVWQSGVAGTCLIGRPNCGIEALAALPGGRLFVGREREPRAAYLFDLPEHPCEAGTLRHRVALKLPKEVGSDISAATYDAATGHLLLVGRSSQRVVEVELAPDAHHAPDARGDARPPELRLLGVFSFATTENALDYAGLDFHQVEGIAVDEQRVLYLAVDSNGRLSRSLGGGRAALLRFFPVE